MTEKRCAGVFTPGAGHARGGLAGHQGLSACLQAARTPQEAYALSAVRHDRTEDRLSRTGVKQGLPGRSFDLVLGRQPKRIDNGLHFANAWRVMCSPLPHNRDLLRAGSLIAGK